jgi:mono/diheme cytochrome c family protein
MDQKSKIALRAMCALACGLYLSKEAFGQTLPDGKGKVEFVHNCTACHTAKLVTRVKKTPEDWRKSVDEMAARGTDGSKEDLDNVVVYLVTNYGTDQAGPTAATQSTTPLSTSGEPVVLNSSQTERVNRLINENGCLTCHRIEKLGAYIGPTLNGLATRHSANEIRAAIVSPRHTLHLGSEEKITGEELDLLVRYLGSLPSVDESVQK